MKSPNEQIKNEINMNIYKTIIVSMKNFIIANVSNFFLLKYNTYEKIKISREYAYKYIHFLFLSFQTKCIKNNESRDF